MEAKSVVRLVRSVCSVAFKVELSMPSKSKILLKSPVLLGNLYANALKRTFQPCWVKFEYDGTSRAEIGSEPTVELSSPSACSIAEGAGIPSTAEEKTEEKAPSASDATEDTPEAAAEVTELTADPA